MNKLSKKHHYLPRHYLRGFTNEKGTFFVYDKKSDKITERTPDNAFFENNLNTITFKDGRRSDFMENTYAYFERKSWVALDKIRASSSISPVDLMDKLDLFLFLLFLHWRIPANLKVIEDISNAAFDDKKELNFFSVVEKNGQKVSKETLDLIKNDESFKKALRLILPFAPFGKDKNWQNDVIKWRFLYPADNKNWYIVGDNPIITEGVYDNNPTKCLKEFVFPVSGKILLISTNPPPINQEFPPSLIIEYNVALIQKADRFVAGPDRDLLESLVKYYKFHENYGKTQIIISRLFQELNPKKK